MKKLILFFLIAVSFLVTAGKDRQFLNKEVMNARDLRIGNIVFDKSRSEHDFEKLGNGIYRVSAHAIERFDAGFMDLKPVHLTSEWLERFGFIKEAENKYAIYYDGAVLFGYWPDGAVNVGQFIPRDIKYVHQLQNLYFALTGSELQLKD